MTDLTSILRRRVIPGLLDAMPEPDGLRTWISKGSYTITAGAKPNEFSLANIDLDEILGYALFDYSRNALASFESLCSSRLEYFNRKAKSWPLLKRYYSAFFAGHAVMRAVGEGIIRLESEKANHLTSVGKLYCGDQFSVSGGNYALSFQISAISKLTINFENLIGLLF